MTAAGRKGRSSSAGSAAEMEVAEEPVQGGGRSKRAGAGSRTAGIKAQPVQRSQSNPVGKASAQSLQRASLPQEEGPAVMRRGRAKRGKTNNDNEEGQYSTKAEPPQDTEEYQQRQGQGGGDGMNVDYPMDDSRSAPGYEQYESDDSQRSSPAMSSAALALASMFHGQQGHEGGEGVMGYAFPLEDSKQPPNKRGAPPTPSPGSGHEGNGESPADGYEGYGAGMYAAEGEPMMQMMPMAMAYEENENCRAQGNRPYRYTMGVNHHMKPGKGSKKKGRKGQQAYAAQADAQMAAMWGKRKAMMMEPGQEEGMMPEDEQGQQQLHHQQVMEMGYVLGPDGQPQPNMYRGGAYDDPNYQHQMAACGHDTEEYDDNASGMQYQLSGAVLGSYNRKEKSLGLLCENFIKRFSDPAFQDPEVGISLDRAATVLGVERRRIYDIINILESVCYVSRKCKNTYIWHGQVYLNQVLKQLQEEALDLWPEDAKANGLMKDGGSAAGASQGKSGQQKWAPDFGGGNVPEDRKEKSLGRLSQKFIQLFLIGYEVISLSGAAEKLLGATPGPAGSISDKGMKTKVRRLYDIANVLTSLRLIDKVQVPDSRKPSFRWVGLDPTALMTQTFAMPPPIPAIQEQPSKKSSRSSSGSNSSSSSHTHALADTSPDMGPPAAAHGSQRSSRGGSDDAMPAATTKTTETPTRLLPAPPPPPPQAHTGPIRGMAAELTPLSPDSMMSPNSMRNYQMSQVQAYMQNYTEEWNQWRTRRLHLGAEQAGPPPPDPSSFGNGQGGPQINGTTTAPEGSSEDHTESVPGAMDMMSVTEAAAAAHDPAHMSSSSYNGAAFLPDQAAAAAPPEVSGPTLAV